MKKKQKRKYVRRASPMGSDHLPPLKDDLSFQKFISMQTAFKVETGVPIAVRGASPADKYPDLYNAMKGLSIGDCITYSTADLAGAVAALRKILDNEGIHFLSAKVDATISRTWRIDGRRIDKLQGVNTFKKKKK